MSDELNNEGNIGGKGSVHLNLESSLDTSGVEQGAKRIKRATEDIGKATSNMASDNTKAMASLREIDSLAKHFGSDVATLTAELKKYSSGLDFGSFDEARTACDRIMELRDEIALLQENYNEASNAVAKFKSQYGERWPELNAIQEQLDGTGKSLNKLSKDADKSFNAATKSVQKHQKDLEGAVDKIMSGVKRLIATYLSFRAVTGFFRTMVNNTVEQEKVERQLEATLRATGNAAGISAAELKKHAIALQGTTTYGDEAILSMQGLLLTFKNIQGNTFKEATAATMDLATALGIDLSSAARYVGRALDQPTRGLDSLRRMGVTFSEQTKKTVKSLAEQGNAAAAQKVILDELKSRFGGLAEASRDTLGGALTSLGNTWRNLWEMNNDQQFMSLTGSVNRLNDALRSDAIKTFKSHAANLAAGALNGLMSTLQWISEHIDAVAAGVSTLMSMKIASWIFDITAAIKQMDAATLALAKSAIMNPLTWAALLLGKAVFTEIYNSMKHAAEQAKMVDNAIKGVNDRFKEASAEQLKTEIKKVTDELNQLTIDAKQAEIVLLELSTATFISGRGISASIKPYVDMQGKTITDLVTAKKAELDELNRLFNEKNNSSGSPSSTDIGGGSGKSVAEKLVENIRDQMKYLGADGRSFLGVLDGWLAKLKPLSEDWKKVKDLVNDIYGLSIQDDSAKADRVLERIEKEKQALKEEEEMWKRANSEYLADLAWRNSQGFITNQQYFDQTMAQWNDSLNKLKEKGLELGNLVTFPDDLRRDFEAAKEATLKLADPAMRELKKAFDEGNLSFEKYNELLTQLLVKQGAAPEIIRSILADVEKEAGKASKSIININDLTKEWIADFQSGIADAIVDGKSFGDTLSDIGKEIEKMMLKLILFGKDGQSGWFGGIGSWILKMFTNHAGGIVGKEHTSIRQAVIPRFHGGGIVGSNEVPTILEKGEGVFTREQMKALGNIGGGVGSVSVSVSVTNNGSGSMSDKQAEELGRSIRTIVKAEVNNSLYEAARSGMLKSA